MSRSLTPDELCSLVDEHFSTLLLFARQFSCSGAEDLVQDALMQLVRRSRWEGCPEQPVAWLFQVIRNGAVDRFRKEAVRQRHEETLRQDRTLWFSAPPDSVDSAEEIESMLEAISPPQREIVVARIWGSMSFDEIAAMLQMSRTTVFRQYTEALEIMRKRHGNETD